MTYKYAVIEKGDLRRIDQLNKLDDKTTFWDEVRKLTKNVKSDHVIGRWQGLAELRYIELLTSCEDIRIEIEYGKPIRYFSWETGEEVFVIE